MRGRPLASSRRSGAQVEGGCGAVAVHIMPRFVLHNLLDLPLQCKQAGTAVERELTPGVPARPPLHTPSLRSTHLVCRTMLQLSGTSAQRPRRPAS